MEPLPFRSGFFMPAENPENSFKPTFQMLKPAVHTIPVAQVPRLEVHLTQHIQNSDFQLK